MIFAITYTPRLTTGMRQLLELPNRLRNLRPFVERSLAPAAAAMLKQHWDSKGAAFGHPWAAWAISTRLERIRKGNADKGILRDTDHLFRALFRSLLSPERIQTIPGGLRLSLGLSQSEDPKAIFHQLGTSRMPARQVVPDPLPRSFRDVVRSMLKDYVLTGQIRGASGRFVRAT
jgi:hypothetical protein